MNPATVIRLGGRVLFSVTLAASVMSPVWAQSLPGSGKSVRAARATFDTFWYGTVIVNVGLERLGYKVEDPLTLSQSVLYDALSKGDAHYTVDTVIPFSNAMLEKYKENLVNVGTIMDPSSIAGYLVDRASSEKHNIRYLSDLRNAEKARVFDDGDGRARMIGPNAGWGSEATVLKDMKNLQLDKTVKLVQGEYNVLVADTVARYKSGKPVLLFGWYPNTATVQLVPGRELVWLQLKADETDPKNATAGVVGCSGNANPCNTGSPPTQYLITVNKAWAAANPPAVKFMSLIKMKLQDRVEQNHKMIVGNEKRDADLRDHAKQWIAANQKQFDSWIEEAKRAK